MRIYTRGGDDGSTGLFGGTRLSKADLQVVAYGAVDELNATLGWVRASEPPEAVDRVLGDAQQACFRLGAWLACAAGKEPGVPAVDEADVVLFESSIDALEADLPALKSFILPGGCESGARLHVARTVCRRAERDLVALAAGGAVDPAGIRWLNRLSDLLFVQARWVNHDAGSPEVPWLPSKD